MNAYYRYNQIPMFRPDMMKTVFMTEQANYQYNIIPFVSQCEKYLSVRTLEINKSRHQIFFLKGKRG